MRFGDRLRRNPKVVLLQIEGLQVPRQLPLMYRFFLNRPDADAYTEPDPAAGYIGNFVMSPLVGEGRQPVMTSRSVLVEGVLKDIAANDQNSVTIVPVGVDIPLLGLKGPKGPAIEANFVRLSLSVGE